MPGDPPFVIVVDDDETVAEVVGKYLEREGYRVETIGDGQIALDRILSEPPDLVVLDLMLPSVDGLEICRRLHALAPVPIVMLTAKGDESDRIIGLELGADDYLAKPFSPRELVARVKAVLRRASGAVGVDGGLDPVLEVGELVVDVPAHEVRLREQIVSLTSREFELLVHLMRHPRTAFRREELLERVWGYSIGDTSTVTVHIRRLREKIEANPSEPRHLVTVWGVGYRFEP